ncbi:LysR family transcriptional regulator [Poseidonocella sp. HB161398]|uniref:LysR family transcriptional regulator n=1 Tax=Poseidonocella sp. HB161398 TaxID=2320855 RepID=UPI001109B951|nr:LysR family transcriptional regulator [Poseidonocella sp. HB161398]
MTNSPPLPDLLAFAAVARHRSFSRAAEEIGVSRSALSHTLRTLEQRLQLRLLNRTTRSVALTEDGADLLARLLPVLGDLDEIFADLAEQRGEPRGTLRINAPDQAARLLMRHVVPDFLALHPRMQVDLSIDGRFVDIVTQGFDAGVRLAEAVPQDMIAVPFAGPLRFVAVAAPAYLAQHPAPHVPADLAAHRCIRQRLPGGSFYQWEFERDGRAETVDVPGVLTLNNNPLMAEAAAAGLGIAYVPETVARDALEAGRLQLVLEPFCPPSPGLCLYYPGRRHVPAGLRAFITLLKQRLPD